MLDLNADGADAAHRNHARDGLRGGRTSAARVELPIPRPGPGQLLLRVHACGVCRTDLHLLDGEVEVPSPPRVLGHQIVGTVVGDGEDASAAGEPGGARRVGVPWLGWTDGECAYCTSGRENLCPDARFTGRDIDGGYAEYALADERYCFAIPPSYTDEQAAPLLCAGLIGYRALRICGEARRVRLLRLWRRGAHPHPDRAWQGREVYAFTRPAATRRCRASPASSARYGRARRMSRRHSRSTPRSSSPQSARWCRSAARGSAGRHGGLRRDPHERHPELPLPHPLGGARAALGGQPHAPRRRGAARARTARRCEDAAPARIASPTPTRRSTDLAPGASPGQPWSCRRSRFPGQAPGCRNDSASVRVVYCQGSQRGRDEERWRA